MLKPPESFHVAARALGLELSDDVVALLGQFLDLLLQTNKQFNLTAIRDPDQAWMRHGLDSLSILPFIDEAKTVIDVGSGGGLPGIPLAIARPDIAVTCLDATGKKVRFIETAARELGLQNVAAMHDRAETIGQNPQHRARYDLAVARAIGPMNVLLELLLPLVKVDGRVLAMKGRRVEEELQDCGDALMKLGAGEVGLYESLPGLEEDAVVVIVTKASATPKQYPRRPGIPKQEPL